MGARGGKGVRPCTSSDRAGLGFQQFAGRHDPAEFEGERRDVGRLNRIGVMAPPLPSGSSKQSDASSAKIMFQPILEPVRTVAETHIRSKSRTSRYDARQASSIGGQGRCR